MAEAEFKRRSLLKETFRRLKRNKMAMFSMGYIVLIIIASLIIPFFVSLEEVQRIGVYDRYVPPGFALKTPLGTDAMGRDVLVRIIYGARVSLIIAIVSTLVSIFFGVIIGGSAAYIGGRFENFVMRSLDVLYSIPSILLAIAIMTAFGGSFFTMILAFTLWGIPGYGRIMRGAVLEVLSMEYVEAIQACGATHKRILFFHIFPNCIAPIIVRATLSIGGAIIGIATLSYLGIGVDPNIPEWGRMLSDAQGEVNVRMYLSIIPGLAIISVVLAFNFFGDGLRDALDPKLRS